MRLIGFAGSFGMLVAAALVGCGGGGTDDPASGGTIAIDGSSTVFRISKAARIGYARAHGEGTQVLVNNSGTGGGFGRYLQGEVDIVDASRPAKPAEEADAKAKGYDWTRFVVGYDGITVVVNPQNDFCRSLTVDQLREIFRPDSPIRNWKQVDPSYPDLQIVFYTPDNDSGTFDFFTEAIVGEEGSQRKDVQASSDDNTLVTGVSGDRGALGYFGYAYYAANAERVKAVPVQDGTDAPPVAPDRKTILGGTYRPLSRPLYIYAKNSALRRPEVAEFLGYYIRNLDELATLAGYVPPKPEDQRENLAKLPDAASASPIAGTDGAPAAAAPAAGTD